MTDPDNLDVDPNEPLGPPEGEEVEERDTGVVSSGDDPQTELDHQEGPLDDPDDDDEREDDDEASDG